MANKSITVLMMCLVALAAGAQMGMAHDKQVCYQNCHTMCGALGLGAQYCEMSCVADCDKGKAAKVYKLDGLNGAVNVNGHGSVQVNGHGSVQVNGNGAVKVNGNGDKQACYQNCHTMCGALGLGAQYCEMNCVAGCDKGAAAKVYKLNVLNGGGVKVNGNGAVKVNGHGSVKVNGNGAVKVNGHGSVKVNGNGAVKVNGVNGAVKVNGNGDKQACYQNCHTMCGALGLGAQYCEMNCVAGCDKGAAAKVYKLNALNGGGVKVNGHGYVKVNGHGSVKVNGHGSVKVNGNGSVKVNGNGSVKVNGAHSGC